MTSDERALGRLEATTTAILTDTQELRAEVMHLRRGQETVRERLSVLEASSGKRGAKAGAVAGAGVGTGFAAALIAGWEVIKARFGL